MLGKKHTWRAMYVFYPTSYILQAPQVRVNESGRKWKKLATTSYISVIIESHFAKGNIHPDFPATFAEKLSIRTGRG